MIKELQTLREIEKKLVAKLHADPTFIQLESLRATIGIFEGKGSKSNIQSVLPLDNTEKQTKSIPTAYNENDTWKQRISFIINNLNGPGAAEIISYMLEKEPNMDKKFVTKRVHTTLMHLRDEESVEAKKEDTDKSSRYFIKK